MKYFWDTPPPKKKAQGYERSRYGCTDNSYEYTQCTGGLSVIAHRPQANLKKVPRNRVSFQHRGD